jgi:hypothetical protein
MDDSTAALLDAAERVVASWRVMIPTTITVDGIELPSSMPGLSPHAPEPIVALADALDTIVDRGMLS